METMRSAIKQYVLNSLIDSITLGGAIFSLLEVYGKALASSKTWLEFTRHILGALCVMYQGRNKVNIQKMTSFMGELVTVITEGFSTSLIEIVSDPVSKEILTNPGENVKALLDSVFPFALAGSESATATVQTAGEESVWKNIKQSKFASALLMFLSTSLFGNFLLSTEQYCTNEHVKFLLRTLQSAIRNAGGIGALATLSTLLITDVVPAIVSGDISTLTPNTYMIKIDCISEFCSALNRQDNVALSAAIKKWRGAEISFDDPTLFTEAKKIANEMKVMITSNRDAYMTNTNRSMVDQLTAAQVAINNMIQLGMGRKQPMCIGLTGPAGCGKSEFVDLCTAALAGELGMTMVPSKDDPAVCVPPKAMNLNSGDKFFDNFSSSTQVILIDDIGIVNDSTVGVPLYTAFMAINGTVPYTIPRSSIENKSGQFFNNKLTFVTSNQKDYGSKQYITNNEAFMRRVIVDVHFVIKQADPLQMEYHVSSYRGPSKPRRRAIAHSIEELILICRWETVNFIKIRDDYRAQKEKRLLCCAVCKKIRMECSCSLSTSKAKVAADCYVNDIIKDRRRIRLSQQLRDIFKKKRQQECLVMTDVSLDEPVLLEGSDHPIGDAPPPYRPPTIISNSDGEGEEEKSSEPMPSNVEIIRDARNDASVVVHHDTDPIRLDDPVTSDHHLEDVDLEDSYDPAGIIIDHEFRDLTLPSVEVVYGIGRRTKVPLLSAPRPSVGYAVEVVEEWHVLENENPGGELGDYKAGISNIAKVKSSREDRNDFALIFDAYNTESVIAYTIIEEVLFYFLKLLVIPAIPSVYDEYSFRHWFFAFILFMYVHLRYAAEEKEILCIPRYWQKWVLFLIITLLPFLPACVIHVLFNVSLSRPGHIMGYIHLISYYTNLPFLGMWAYDYWYVPYVRGPRYCVNIRSGDTMFVPVFKNDYVEKSWMIFLAKIGVSAFLIKYIVNWLLSPSTQYTMLGMPAVPSDVEANKRLAKMVDDGYVVPQTGVTNTYNKKQHTTVPTYSSANPVAYIASLQTVSQGKIWKAYAWVNDGRLLTVKHFIRSFPDQSISVSYRDKLYTVNFMNDLLLDKHDIGSIPFLPSNPAKRLNIIYSYHPDASDTFEVAGEEYRFKKFVTGDGEPDGCFMLDMVSKQGNSGLPVFWRSRAGKSVRKEFVGMISRMTKDGNFAIVCPITVQPPCGVEYNLSTEDVQKDLQEKTGSFSTFTHQKSILGHLDQIDKIGEYVCTIPMPPVKSATKIRKSELYESVILFDPRVNDLGLPTCVDRIVGGNYISPFLATARQMSSCGEIVDHATFLAASIIVTKEILKKADFSSCAPFSIAQTIHGTTLTQPLNRTTSAGFGLSGKKDDYVVGSFEEPMFTRSMAEQLIRALEHIDNGGCIINYAKASVKDEVIAKVKSADGLERVFFVGSMVYLLLCRQYLGPIMEIFMINRNVLFGQIGMNAIGSEFHDRLLYMMDKVKSTPEDRNWLDSDFAKYDKTLFVLRYGVQILHRIVDTIPFYQGNKKENGRIRAIINSLAQYVMILRNDVFLMSDKMPSGVFGTAWVNCLCEAIIEVVQFHYLHWTYVTGKYPTDNTFVNYSEQLAPFFDNVALINYGDDNLKCVAKHLISIYNHDSIMHFSNIFKMKITPAQKSALYIEPKVITEILFLKRIPRMHDVLGRYVGALDTLSISRMLAFTDSDDPRWKEAVIDQALREASLHPRTYFDQIVHLIGSKYSYEEAAKISGDMYITSVDIEEVETYEFPSPVFGASN